ncbi:heterokaryon incompatibility protein-domain-containing protein [Boeremia exigua]|uniref:heterokaryon incompatibility protein-domain-containing protein n=1 Tax=Boeremia exigua TaxID=749465 RepID=UPI001E8E1D21|nr:heterokaryon incompatibility protein-domain-containing protein [Boeremia exigua]KAH6629704.1 heterokaryon incompatibility protein-domain-containing protein [Boeremia exigua]
MSAFELTSVDLYSQLLLDKTRQQIRLLKVIRSTSGPVECTMEVFDLDTSPPYTALSYRWGSPIAEHTVFVNGHLSLVSYNLFSFLETYRLETQDEYLWIDQICIAQSNTEERNHQVALMSQIYRRCRCTIVWLCDERDAYSTIAKEFNRTRTKKALSGLLCDSYFSRLWIVQEVLLASTLWMFTFGGVWISWEDVRTCFWEKAWEPEDAILKALVVPDFLSRGKDLTLGSCILTFSGQNCQNPKDRVYGLLGMVKEGDCIVVDYNKSIYQIYVEAVVAVGPLGGGRDKCAEHLGNLFDIPTRKREQLIAFLDLVQPIHFIGQVSVLRDCSPKTPYGSGLVSSIGLAFAEQPVTPPESISINPLTNEPFTAPELARSVTLDKLGTSWTDAFNGPDGGLFDHEALTTSHKAPIPSSSCDTDLIPLFNPLRAIVDFHHCVHESEWAYRETSKLENLGLEQQLKSKDTGLEQSELKNQALEAQVLEAPDFVGPKYPIDDWGVHESLAAKTFWTYVAVRKDVSRPEDNSHPHRPKKCRRRWCYGYQGYVYEYSRHPKWHLLFGSDINMIVYASNACKRVRSIIYYPPIDPTGDARIHWVQRLPETIDFGSEDARTAFIESGSAVFWNTCKFDGVCQRYDKKVTIEREGENSREAILRKFPDLRETPW